MNIGSGRASWLRIGLVALFDALVIAAVPVLITDRLWVLLILLGFVVALVNWAYLVPRNEPARWLAPGVGLMVVFVAFPVLYTAYISLTNWQTGNVLTKEQVIDQLEERRVRSDGAAETGPLSVYRSPAGDLALGVGGDGVEPFVGLASERDSEGDPEPLEIADFDPENPPETIGDFELLARLAVTGEASRLEDSQVIMGDGRVAFVDTLSTYRVASSGLRFAYDADADTLTDNQLNLTCSSGEGTFVCDDVPRGEVAQSALNLADSTITCGETTCDQVPLFALDESLPGWRQVVGFDNYEELFTNKRLRAPFIRVFVWNVAFAAISVLSTFALGLGLAITLKPENMRGKAYYRSIYILPYAIPAFLSVLIWRGLLNPEYGKVNAVIETFGLPGVDWFGTTVGAMAAVLMVNLWLGFPYMFLITTGALTSVPEELLEAARVDGAGPWRSFRSITLPLLLVSTAPLLIGSFAFNFNNFVLVYLLTEGRPPLAGYDVRVGATDLLISFTFNLAQNSGRGSQFALSSAIVVIIFLVLATTAGISFRLTKRLEEIYE